MLMQRLPRVIFQAPKTDIGVDTFEFWIPHRWPEGKNFAIHVEPAIDLFNVENLRNGIARSVFRTKCLGG